MSINVNSFASVALRAQLTKKQQEKEQEDKLAGAFSDAHKARVEAFVKAPQEAINTKFREMLMRKARVAKGHVSGINEMSEAHHTAMEEINNWHDIRAKHGPVSRFGDGDGSWWDRWLVCKPPEESSFETGYSCPQSGFKKTRPTRHFVAVPDGSVDTNGVGIRSTPYRTWRQAAGFDDGMTKLSRRSEVDSKRLEGGEKGRGGRRDGRGGDRASDSPRSSMAGYGQQAMQFQFQTDIAKNRAESFERLVKGSTDRLLSKMQDKGNQDG